MTQLKLPTLALSIRQPWVWAIVNAGKNIENRDWRTKVRGPICLHAAKGMKDAEFDWAMNFVDDAIGQTSVEHTLSQQGRRRAASDDAMIHRRGGIIATAEIVDCVTSSDSPWFMGNYGFVLANIRPVDFIPVRGMPGFFDWRKNLTGGDA